ncbi:MAG: peptidylprolyl isomerase [candidate division NC10 bacterium]|nr:peptidylprolyl isomerase [candidate division NC10 bacterium]
MRRKVGLWVLISAVALGCSASPGGSTEAKDKVILKVNDTEMTVADFEKELDRLPPQLKPMASSKEGQKQLLEELASRELLVQEAEKRKIGDRPEVVEQAKEFRKRLLLQTLVNEEIGSKITVDDPEVEAYYKTHPEEFSNERIRAKHILVETEEEAKKVMTRLKKEKFEDLAKEVSLDKASGASGGDLNYFGRGQMVPEFEKVAFALKVGETSGIVKTQFGYHIIRLMDRKTSEPTSFEQVKDRLKQKLLNEKQRKQFDEWLASLKEEAKIQIQEDLLPVGEVQEAPKAEEKKE